MSWKDILKVDNIEFNPNMPPAYYDPIADTVTLNLANRLQDVDEEGKTYEEIDIEQGKLVINQIIHEYTHKGIASETAPLLKRTLHEIVNGMSNHILNNRPIGDLTEAVLKFAKILGYEEAMAYISGNLSTEQSIVNITESVLTTLQEPLQQSLNAIMLFIGDMVDARERRLVGNPNNREIFNMIQRGEAVMDDLNNLIGEGIPNILLALEREVREFLIRHLDLDENEVRNEQQMREDAFRRMRE